MLSAAESDRIAAAVAAAEAKTAGEILCVVAHEAGEHAEVPVGWAAAAALVLPPGAILGGLSLAPLAQRFSGWAAAQGTNAGGPVLSVYVMVQAAVFLLVLLLVSIAPVRRALTPGVLKRRRAHRAALQHFALARASLPPDRPAVMIFAALADRQVQILADDTVHAAVGQSAWDEAVARAVAAMRSEGPGAGLAQAVEVCGAALAEHFPPDGRSGRLADRPLEL